MGSTQRALPTGGCNFCDITQSVALSCGCQKFWLRKRKRGKKAIGGVKEQSASKGSTKGKEVNRISRISEEREGGEKSPFVDNGDDTEDDDDDDEDCRCGHHACYHSFESPISTRTQSTGRRYSLQISDTETSLRLDGSATNLAASGFSITSGTTTERDYSTTTEPSPSVVAARNIKHHKRQRSQLGTDSSTSKSNSQTTDHVVSPRMQLTLESFMSRMEQHLQQASTTASMSTIVPTRSSELAEISAKLTKLLEVTELLQKSSRSHHERLETVETFSSVLEEIRDKIELVEDRSNEVEEKVFSFENRLDDRLAPIESLLKARNEKRKDREREGGEDGTGSFRARKRRKGGREKEVGALVDASSQQEIKTTTTTSFTTTMSTSTSYSGTPNSKDGRESTMSRVLSLMEHIESRLVEIESVAPPTISRPWVVEAVLLPPAPLRGIWVDGPGSAAGYESSNPQSVSTFSGTYYSRKQSYDYDSGPLPRSFGVNSRLYRRLNTRGFIKPLLVQGPTAHDVAAAVDTNFHELLEWCHSFYAHDSTSPQGPPTLNPRVSLNWQPLRKVHKQTNLEYLKPGEMVEGMWTVEFLKASCIMKGRRQVLYITPLLSVHPALISPYSGITWSDVKALPVATNIIIDEVGKDFKLPSHLQQLEQETTEDCWAWKEALDEIPQAPKVSASLRSGSPGSWSSFGPFQLEDEAKINSVAQHNFSKEGETHSEVAPGSRRSPGPPSPPMSLPNRKRKPSSPLDDSGSKTRDGRVQRRLRRGGHSPVEAVIAGTEGLTPALTATRSSSYPPSSVTGSRGSMGRQGSVFEGFSAAADWELSPGTLGWFTEHPIEEEGAGDESEEQEEVITQEERATAGETVEDIVEDNTVEDVEGAVLEGDGGYGSAS